MVSLLWCLCQAEPDFKAALDTTGPETQVFASKRLD